MKKINIYAFLMLTVLGITIGCSTDSNRTDVQETTASNASNKRTSENDPEIFLKLYYDEAIYSYGESELVETEEGNYKVKEVIIGNDSQARGYVIMDENDENLLFFMDIERTTKTMHAVDLVAGEEETIEDLGSLPFYDEVNGDMMQLLSWEPGPKTRFFGWGPSEAGNCEPARSPEDGEGCFNYITQTYYAFWIGIKDKKVMRLDKPDLQLTSPCDCPE